MKNTGILLLIFSFFFSSVSSAQFLPDSNSCFSNHLNLELKSGTANRISSCSFVNIEATFSKGNPYIFWNNGNSGNILTVYQTGVYQAYAMDSAGCYDTTASVYVEIQKSYPTVYSNTFYNYFCSGSSLNLSVYNNNKGKWSSGESTNEITISKGGKYYYISTSDSGCKDTSNILEITEIKVKKPKLSVTGKTTICKQDTTWIETTSTDNISWYPYGFGNKIRATTSGMHYAIASDPVYGCTANSDTINMTVYEPFVESLCMVTNDSNTGRNMLMWNKTPGKRTEKYEIYRESNTAGGYDKIGTLDYNATPRFIDSTSIPRQRSYSYYLRAIDSCGNSAEESIYYIHTTSHLTASIGVSGENNLTWTQYFGLFPINGFVIFRSNNGGAFQEIDRVSSTKTSYSDLNPPSGSNRYYIGIIADVDCGTIKGTVTFRSNQVQFGTASSKQVKNAVFSLYPNPASAGINVSSESNATYVIKDLSGRTVTAGMLVKGNNEISLNSMAAGTYIFVSGKQAEKLTIVRQ